MPGHNQFEGEITRSRVELPARESEVAAQGALSFQNSHLHLLVGQSAFGAQADSPLNSGDLLRHSFRACLPAGVAGLKFGGFCQEWGASLVSQDQELFTYHIPLPVSVWQRLLGCTVPQSRRVLNAVGQELLESIQCYFQTHPERRHKERHPFQREIQFYPVLPSFNPRDIRGATSKDLSLRGMRFWSPSHPSGSHIGIRLPGPLTVGSIRVLARVQRVQPVREGGYDVAVVFPTEEG
jgi:hypothetical protein